MQSLRSLNYTRRENIIYNKIISGEYCSFNWKEIALKNKNYELKINVLNDYLSIGDPDDYIRIPLSKVFAEEVCREFNCYLPTVKIVDEIWKQADIKLSPSPNGAPYDRTHMASVDALLKNHHNIEVQLIDKDKSLLIAGHKKDLINYSGENVAIYGWHQLNGKVIQGLNKEHDKFYYDYSHGIRLIESECKLNGEDVNFGDVLAMKEDLEGLI